MVNGPMLCEKRKRFKELFKVPEDQRLQGEGWVTPFCKAYKLKEYRHHGEAASVDDQAADRECKCVQELMKRYVPSPCRTDCRNARQNQLQKGRKGR